MIRHNIIKPLFSVLLILGMMGFVTYLVIRYAENLGVLPENFVQELTGSVLDTIQTDNPLSP